MEEQVSIKKRINSIDVLRGLVMIIMALDHARDYFHITANTDDPLNLATTSPALYFTRWITHFCAPIFVFLSGTSVYLQSLRKTKKELSGFLIKRGLWLILVEWLIISLAWTFNPNYEFIPLQVIWAIGICMVLLGVVIWLPFNLIIALGLLIVCGHNLLDIPESKPGFDPGFFWDLSHSGFFTPYAFYEGHNAIIVYPFLAWTGVMMLGYCTGKIFTPAYSIERRKRIFLITGAGLILFFLLLRLSNVYGDPVNWTSQRNGLYSFFSFMNVRKYPPSLLYLCITVGPGLIFLALIEKTQNAFTRLMSIYGRVAFFYYILHLYLIHLLATISFFLRGHSISEAETGGRFPFFFVVPGEGYGLAVVYGVWALVIILLYPLCKWYDRYKTNHKEKWWLSYL